MPKKPSKRKTIALPADLYARCKSVGKTQPFITSANAVVVGYVKAGLAADEAKGATR
jgi:hypothetical protein